MGVKNKIKRVKKAKSYNASWNGKGDAGDAADDSGDWKPSLQSESRVIFKNRQVFWSEGGGNIYAGVRRKKINDKLERFQLE